MDCACDWEREVAGCVFVTCTTCAGGVRSALLLLLLVLILTLTGLDTVDFTEILVSLLIPAVGFALALATLCPLVSFGYKSGGATVPVGSWGRFSLALVGGSLCKEATLVPVGGPLTLGCHVYAISEERGAMEGSRCFLRGLEAADLREEPRDMVQSCEVRVCSWSFFTRLWLALVFFVDALSNNEAEQK